MKRFKTLAAVTVAVCAFQAAAAHATVFDENLSGNVADFQTSTFDGVQDFYLPLSGLTSIDVAQGDEIDSTITLDQAYTLGTDTGHTNILEYLTGSAFPSEDTGVSYTFTFYDTGSVVNTFSGTSTTSDALSSYAAVFPPFNGAFTFDTVTVSTTVTDLAQGATLDGAALDLQLVPAVSAAPEPASWALMMLGVGSVGVALRTRRRKTSAAFA